MNSTTDPGLGDVEKEARRARREAELEGIAKQMAELQRKHAELLKASGKEEQSPQPQSPTRKRKSSVLAEASPVKIKGEFIMLPRTRSILLNWTTDCVYSRSEGRYSRYPTTREAEAGVFRVVDQ